MNYSIGHRSHFGSSYGTRCDALPPCFVSDLLAASPGRDKNTWHCCVAANLCRDCRGDHTFLDEHSVLPPRVHDASFIRSTDIVTDPGDSVSIYEGDTLRLDILVWLAVIRQNIL